ncbi:hypothetical protein AB1Y20_021005 [Prymnesium parvum]|uniref:Galactose oxidase n=1 Tax=Prymnesium parvum TaxID=97485 RepID=A0AB34JK34_PRYPA|mmetsp:Transcript_24372/g.60465  ORF Transcript_24372/g.60465 Transcript_24372/m.60465 type:complete len:597 (+) Transcript_24372:31-1821(+)
MGEAALRLGPFPFREAWRPLPLEGSLEPLQLISPGLLLRGHSCVWLGDSMLIFGGVRGSGELTNDAWNLDPATGTIKRLQPQATAPSRRAFHSAVWTGDEMLLYGGSCGSSCALSDVWSLRLLSSSPPPFPDPPPSRSPAPPTVPAVHLNASIPSGPPPGPETPPSSSPSPPSPATFLGQWVSYNLPPGVFPPSARDRHAAIWAPSLGAMVMTGGTLEQSRWPDPEIWVYYPPNGEPDSSGRVTGGRWEMIAASPASVVPAARQGLALMWTGFGLLIYGGRSEDALASKDMWLFDWGSRCWYQVDMSHAQWTPTQQANAVYLPTGFNSTLLKTDAKPLVVVAARTTAGFADSLTFFARNVEELVRPIDLCAAVQPDSAEAKSLASQRPRWFEYHAGGLEQPVEDQTTSTDTIYLAEGATVAGGDETGYSLVWQTEAGRLLLVGGAAFSSSTFHYRQHVWAFYPSDSLPYFYNTRLYERQLLRNITEREILNFSRSQVVIISGAFVWVMFIGGLLCVCCSCPCFCYYIQSKRAAREKARNDELLWTQQLELVVQATHRQAQSKQAVSRGRAVSKYDPKANVSRDSRTSRATSSTNRP